jgi:hypothetical protein
VDESENGAAAGSSPQTSGHRSGNKAGNAAFHKINYDGMKKAAIVIAVVIALSGVGLYIASVAKHAEAAPVAIQQGFDQANAQIEAENRDLRIRNTEKEMQIIDIERKIGISSDTKKNLSQYVSDLEWAKTQFSDANIQEQLDRDIDWCKRKMNR